jgi:hypothetical protein
MTIPPRPSLFASTTSQRLNEEEMRACLLEAFRRDPEQHLLWRMAERFKDPLSQHDDEGRWRAHPLLLTWAAFAAIVLATFLYFGLLRL